VATKAFISFRGEDEFKVWTLRGLAEFRNVAFDMDDKSLRQAIDSRDDAYIRSVIRPKIKSADVCICMVGENTHRSRKWVPWEIGLAIEERKRVVAMKFWDSANAITPSILTQNRVIPHSWDVGWLFQRL
jgi:MTH538 TIR-like domain (DUF1863)